MKNKLNILAAAISTCMTLPTFAQQIVVQFEEFSRTQSTGAQVSNHDGYVGMYLRDLYAHANYDPEQLGLSIKVDGGTVVVSGDTVTDHNQNDISIIAHPIGAEVRVNEAEYEVEFGWYENDDFREISSTQRTFSCSFNKDFDNPIKPEDICSGFSHALASSIEQLLEWQPAGGGIDGNTQFGFSIKNARTDAQPQEGTNFLLDKFTIGKE